MSSKEMGQEGFPVIGIAGLGLIGGSMTRTIKAETDCRLLGFDINEEVLKTALSDGSIDGILDDESIGNCSLILVALYPRAAVDYVTEKSGVIADDALVIDLCGVKTAVMRPLEPVVASHGFSYIGGHPMAGTEKTGYKNSRGDLFRGASMLLVPAHNTEEQYKRAEAFFLEIGFGRVVRTSMETHDRIIAFTSQLAHVVSNAYVKSPTAKIHDGYSAGSYLDLTRVAWLNEVMWSELFIDNREALADEIDRLIEDLRIYSELIREGRQDELREVLKEGRELKEMIDRKEDRKR